MDRIKLGEIPQIDGVGISLIAKTGTDTYTITKTDNSTFELVIPHGLSIRDIVKVDQIPDPSDCESGVLYLVETERNPPDVYDEYFLINGRMELFGVTTPVLDNYYTKTEADQQIGILVDAAKSLELEYDGGSLDLYGKDIPDVTE